MRRRAPRPLSFALDSLSGALAPATRLARVQAIWGRTVGDAVAAEAQPVREREGTVSIACRSAVWAQELDLIAPDIIARLNEALEEPFVTALRCSATGNRPR
jgi:predicted nucleic acid-binding Zn ribbon protein